SRPEAWASESRPRARAHDRERAGRDRRHARTEGITLVVVVAPVHERDLVGEAQDPFDQLRERRGEAEVHEWLRHLTALDLERAVARHSRDDSFARVDDAETVEVRDVDPVADPFRELGGWDVASANREVQRKRAEALRRRGQRVSAGLAPFAGPLGSSAVPDDVLGNAVLDDGHALLGYALQVESLGHPRGVEPVVDEGEAFVIELLAQAPAEIAAALQARKGSERAEAEVPEKLGEGVGLE